MRGLAAAFGLIVALSPARAQNPLADPSPSSQPKPAATPMPPGYRSPTELKRLPLEMLVDVEITSAARRPEPISKASSAIDVVTSDDIERSGVTNLPDALRLAAGVEVAQVDGHEWAISARGFNIVGANKMQVLLDGRSLYTPLFSGVFWDVQRTFLPDLQQIEVVRGPGATLWGANAVNGVINIETKNAKDTQGFLLDGGGGNELGYAGIRYGGQIGQGTYYRVYVMHQINDSLIFSDGMDAGDDMEFTQGGFRVDSALSGESTLTLQGDGYGGVFHQISPGDVEVDGGNFISRLTHQFDPETSLMVQAYYDRTHRLIEDLFEEHRNTFDLEFEGRFVAGMHDLVYGGNYRLSHDDIGNLGPLLAFIPDSKTVHLVSGYLQDEWHLVPEIFSIAAGSKPEYNTFSGFEIQPSARFNFTPAVRQTLWGAISRAVRTPTRIDQNVISPNPNTGLPPFFLGNPDFESEVLVAYELGYRVEPSKTLSLDFSGFYNDYDDLRSEDPLPPNGLPILIGNNLAGTTYGGTLEARWNVADWWKVSGSITALHLDLHRKRGSTDPTDGAAEFNDPDYFYSIHSSMDLPGQVQFDSYLRYVDDLPHPATPSYVELDARLGWSPCKDVELAVVGRNLLDNAHPEFAGTPATPTREVQRSVSATLRCRF
jgi:iron complex outermembrane receptor protein